MVSETLAFFLCEMSVLAASVEGGFNAMASLARWETVCLAQRLIVARDVGLVGGQQTYRFLHPPLGPRVLVLMVVINV